MSSVHVLSPTGILNGESGEALEEQIRTALESTTSPLLVDCSALTFMDSSGFGHLVVALKLARQQQRDLFLCGLSAQLLMVLQLTGTDKVFRMFESRQDCEDSLAATS
ncbi:STAS domain-containing protein [Synechococcus sp. CBW1107]|uniref:STAS domain-containing protein n=1 Tax=Synechococcus sp. CBW1107 TaxID=2789857 RepID=UPI002AD1E769|nr:STAS domain-containing protein [Synechococcus sp. CBW1107]CAK6695893.1 Putative anti-sigma factor antagonist [Synechococcus sp. CBW1107]